MTYVQFPYQVLSQLGQNLSDVSSRLTEGSHGATDCAGLGGDGQSAVQDAVSHFRGEWRTSVSQLAEDIGSWSGLSKAVGDMVSQFDAQAAAAMLPSGGSAANHP